MNKENEKIKYFLYVRKSSEGEERQVQSIPDQTDRLTKLAEEMKFEIVEILPESKSAKNPNNRPVFDKMLERIENGEADGILCWEINRLSRNPVDSGKIQWLLQQSVIKIIRTINREYRPDDNALLLSVESGSANQFILDLKKGVKRGIDSKLVKGMAPILAPLGYLNTKTETRGENYIVKDPERFPIIRKMWDLMLSGNYTPPKIRDIANDEWGLRTRKTKRKGGKPISRSTIYRIFTDPFYVGLFEYGGRTHQGTHEPMVTFEEYDRVQIMLGREGKPRPKTHHFAFTGMIRCGECGCAITAIEKPKIIKATGKLKNFTYYFCTRKKNGVPCSQNKYLSSEMLEEQIESELGNITILPEFKDWALTILRENNDNEITERTAVYENQHKTLTATQRQLDALTKMRYSELISDEEFVKERKSLQNQIAVLTERVRSTEVRAVNWLELTEKTFEFACHAREAFVSGDLDTKKEILSALGQNYTLKDRKLVILPNEWLKPIIERYPAMEKEYNRLELTKYKDPQRRKEAFASLSPILRGWPDLNR
ncbi:MAG: recombinase family protein [Candidatus Taylorbacteria bacterium]|nr:recombinase family protein [Candidatus Taylorbacteria bacterium]